MFVATSLKRYFYFEKDIEGDNISQVTTCLDTYNWTTVTWPPIANENERYNTLYLKLRRIESDGPDVKHFNGVCGR